MMTYFYLSFATNEKGLGATVVEADSKDGAITKCNELGINPGGEVLCITIPERVKVLPPQLQSYMNRLVSMNELLANGAVRINEIPDEAKDKMEPYVSVLHSEHNRKH